MLRKLLIILTSTAVILSLSTAPAFSARHFHKKKAYVRHGMITKHMRYFQKAVLPMYPVNQSWQSAFTRNAPKGFLKYNLWGTTFNFTFRGSKLSSETWYTLIYYKGGEATDFIILGEGETDRRGRVYFENSVDTCSMPAEDDILHRYGARILLVPSDSLYDPDSNAFLEGIHLIRFFDIDGCSTVDPVYEEPVDEEPEYPAEEEPSFPVEEEPGSETPEYPYQEEPGSETPNYPSEEEPGSEDPPIDQVVIPY